MATFGHSGMINAGIVEEKEVCKDYSQITTADGSKFTVHRHVRDENITGRTFGFSGLQFETARDRQIREAREGLKAAR